MGELPTWPALPHATAHIEAARAVRQLLPLRTRAHSGGESYNTLSPWKGFERGGVTGTTPLAVATLPCAYR